MSASVAVAVRAWMVQSSDGKRSYTVRVDGGGKWSCTCPSAWYRRKECKHIREKRDALAAGDVSRGRGEVAREIVLAHVPCVTLAEDGKVLTPLVPMGGGEAGHFTLSVIYDLVRAGIPWSEVKKRYEVQTTFTEISAFISKRGRLVRGPEVRGGTGFDGYLRVKADQALPTLKDGAE